jgi:hypothetical protein
MGLSNGKGLVAQMVSLTPGFPNSESSVCSVSEAYRLRDACRKILGTG